MSSTHSRDDESTPQNSSASSTHLVLIPTYNAGPLVYETVRAARAYWAPVWVVVDGSTDGTAAVLRSMAAGDPHLHVLVLSENQGKGAAVLHGLEAAQAAGYRYALTMDSDGQHPADRIPEFIALSIERPDAMILGKPVFDDSAPSIRVKGRRISNWWTNLETLWAGIGDSLFGFRVYPIDALVDVMRASHWMRRFDFDVEVVVRLCWRGVKPLNIDTPVRYLSAAQGGVSHFKYLRDNVLLTSMHIRLVFGFVFRLPILLARRLGVAAPYR